MNSGAIIQTIIAVIALLFGYPYLGSVFILSMIPFVLFMLIKQDARFLPALILHCASATSITYLIFLTIVIICLTKARVLFADKNTRLIFIMLLLALPLYVVLTYQKMKLDGLTWQVAFHYSSYYLSFWGFLYCFLISKTFDIKTLKLLLCSLIFVYFVYMFTGYSRVVSMIVFLGVVYGVYMLLNTNNKLMGVIITMGSLLLFFSNKNMTFTEFFSMAFAVVVYVLFELNKKKMARKAAGWIPYVVIIVLMVFGINNFQTAQISDFSEHMDFSSWENFWSRVTYKFFEDRAVFWDAGWNQLMQIKPVLPMHNIPDIIAYKTSGVVIDDVSFGAHNTPIQLLRIFGFIIGGLLIVCYILCTTLAATVYTSKNANKWIVPIITVSITNSIVLFLTGTAAMILSFSLFSFGLMGITYGISTKQPNQLDEN